MARYRYSRLAWCGALRFKRCNNGLKQSLTTHAVISWWNMGGTKILTTSFTKIPLLCFPYIECTYKRGVLHTTRYLLVSINASSVYTSPGRGMCRLVVWMLDVDLYFRKVVILQQTATSTRGAELMNVMISSSSPVRYKFFRMRVCGVKYIGTFPIFNNLGNLNACFRR